MFATSKSFQIFINTFNYIKPLSKEYYHDCTAGRKTILDELNTFRLLASIDSRCAHKVFSNLHSFEPLIC